MLKIYSQEFHRFFAMIDFKGSILTSISKNAEVATVFALIGFIASCLGITAAWVASITILVTMTVLDLLIKRTIVARKFGSIKKAREVGFWRSIISREKMAKKLANYSFVIIAVFLMTMPLSLYDIGIGQITTKSLQELLRIVTTFILIGIEFESVMESIKSQFSEEEQERIDAIYNKVKNGTTDLVEFKINKILNSFSDQSAAPAPKKEEEKTEEEIKEIIKEPDEEPDEETDDEKEMI